MAPGPRVFTVRTAWIDRRRAGSSLTAGVRHPSPLRVYSPTAVPTYVRRGSRPSRYHLTRVTRRCFHGWRGHLGPVAVQVSADMCRAGSRPRPRSAEPPPRWSLYLERTGLRAPGCRCWHVASWRGPRSHLYIALGASAGKSAAVRRIMPAWHPTATARTTHAVRGLHGLRVRACLAASLRRRSARCHRCCAGLLVVAGADGGRPSSAAPVRQQGP